VYTTTFGGWSARLAAGGDNGGALQAVAGFAELLFFHRKIRHQDSAAAFELQHENERALL
jgi:hypothetical protein